jgi:hypothetical protein
MPQGHQEELPNGIRHITAGFDTPDPESLPATLSLNPNFCSDDASEAAAEPVSFTTNRPKAKQISIPVMRANRGRSRLGSNTLYPQPCSDPRAAIANNRRVEASSFSTTSQNRAA